MYFVRSTALQRYSPELPSGAGGGVLRTVNRVTALQPGGRSGLRFWWLPFTSALDVGGIKVTWKTDEWADSIVVFGTQPGVYPQSRSDPLYVKDHAVLLTGLAPATYYYRVQCLAALGPQARQLAKLPESAFQLTIGEHEMHRHDDAFISIASLSRSDSSHGGRNGGAHMNILLWVLQIVLAIKFASVAFTHGLRPDPAKMQRGFQRFGTAARPLLILISLGAFLGAVALVLPAATGIAPWLTPWAAALLAVMMLAAAGFHLACREQPKTAVSLVLFALSAFVAYGRWVLVPL